MSQPLFMFIARIAMAVLFLVSGAQKIMSPLMMAPLFEKMGLPGNLGLFVGVFEVVAALAFIFKFLRPWTAWALAAWCLLTGAIGHPFWHDPTQTANFLKNVGLAGAFMAFGFIERSRGDGRVGS
jgi:putative oxidoreductase